MTLALTSPKPLQETTFLWQKHAPRSAFLPPQEIPQEITSKATRGHEACAMKSDDCISAMVVGGNALVVYLFVFEEALEEV